RLDRLRLRGAVGSDRKNRSRAPAVPGRSRGRNPLSPLGAGDRTLFAKGADGPIRCLVRRSGSTIRSVRTHRRTSLAIRARLHQEAAYALQLTIPSHFRPSSRRYARDLVRQSQGSSTSTKTEAPKHRNETASSRNGDSRIERRWTASSARIAVPSSAYPISSFH